jgi:GNAT superfamily N-acetyltransferase
MKFREANVNDVEQMQVVRHAVKENTLSDPRLVTNEHYIEFMMERGKGWVCEYGNEIAGFAIVDLKDHNIWALFVKPGFEKQGIGRQLHHIMLNWYFQQTKTDVWLGTAPGTRAEKFYRKAGWTEAGKHGKGEIKFEMSRETWLQRKETGYPLL